MIRDTAFAIAIIIDRHYAYRYMVQGKAASPSITLIINITTTWLLLLISAISPPPWY